MLSILMLIISIAVDSSEQVLRSNEPTIRDEPAVVQELPSTQTEQSETGEPTLEEKIGQLFLPTIHRVHGLLSAERNFLGKYKPCGVVLTTIIEPKAGTDLVSFVKMATAGAKLPMWIGGDLYELSKLPRGAVSRYVDIPPLLSVCANPDDEVLNRFFRVWRTYAYGLGLNFVMGPHLSLASELEGTASNLHCLGSNPNIAGEIVDSFFKLWANESLMLVPMDFPGGATNKKGVEPSVLLTPDAMLMENDLVPFSVLVKNGHPVLHVGTTLVPTIDPAGMPACVSEYVIDKLLRKQLNYGGVVIAGPLDSPEVVKYMSPSEAGIRALRVGADVLYFQGELNTVARAIDRVKYAIDTGELTQERIEESYAKVKALKDRQFAISIPKDAEKIKGEVLQKSKGDVYEDAYYIIKNSITLVRNHGDLLPLEKGSVAGIGITGAVGVQELSQALSKYHKNIAVQDMRSSFRLGYIEKFEIERAEKTVGKAPIVICIVASALRLAEQEEMVSRLKNVGSKVVAVVLGHPSALSCAKKADAILIAYAEPTSYSIAIKAVAETIVGLPAFRFRNVLAPSELYSGREYKFSLKEVVAMPAGRLPVSVGENFPEGASLSFPLEGLIRKCQWKIGDKVKFDTPEFSFSFPLPGEYTIELKVQGPDKTEKVKTFSVVVK